MDQLTEEGRADHEKEVAAGVARIHEYEVLRREFRERYLSGHKPHYWKKCIVIKFDFGEFSQEPGNKRIAYHRRVSEKTDFLFQVLAEFEINPPTTFRERMDTDRRLLNLGIYATYYWERPHWGIPNDFPQVQEYVKNTLPTWAELRTY